MIYDIFLATSVTKMLDHNSMLPESMEVKMKLTDLRFIKGAMQKNIMGKGAGVELAKEKALYTAVISAIYVRMNDGKYTLTSSANIHKESKAK